MLSNEIIDDCFLIEIDAVKRMQRTDYPVIGKHNIENMQVFHTRAPRLVHKLEMFSKFISPCWCLFRETLPVLDDYYCRPILENQFAYF